MTRIVVVAILIFIVGSALVLGGSLFKIQHWAGGDLLLLAGLGTELAAAVWLVVGLVKRHRAIG